MFYTPKFCSNCGEKIERVSHSITDSEKFCDVCKHDFVMPRLLPVIFAVLMAIFGMFGISSFLRGEKPLNVSTKQLTTNQTNSSKTPPIQTSQIVSNSNVQPNAPLKNISTTNVQTANLTMKPLLKQTEIVPAAPTEAIYFCGAATKKGTPCTRRVKGGGRCWQHKGQPALLPPEALGKKMRDEIARWSKVVKASGMKID